MLASFKAFFMPRKTGVESQHSTAPVNYADRRFDERPSAATRLALPFAGRRQCKNGDHLDIPEKFEKPFGGIDCL